MTPIGLAWGLIEAARFHWWLAVLMAVLLAVISAFVGSVVRRIRAERLANTATAPTGERPPP